MVQILVRARYEELQRFIGGFATRGAAMRRKHGSRHATMLKNSAEDEVILLFDWDSREAFEAFLEDPEVKATMQSSGTLGRPEFTYLEKIAEFPG